MLLTVLTPTYNRAQLLERTYQSLCVQTDKDFEWLIVDDGSTDNTAERVQTFLAGENGFPIRYIYRENGGKHCALNTGVPLAVGRYVMILDSDDYLTPDAVAYIRKWTEEIDGDDAFAGVYGLCGWQKRDGSICGRPEQDGYIDATYAERPRYGLFGDRAEIYKTEIFKKYPFPEFAGEKFIQEAAVFLPIAQDGYKIRWFDRIIYKCEYLEGGLTKTGGIDNFARNFQGHLYCVRLYLKSDPFLYAALKIGLFSKVARRLGKKDGEICRLLGIRRWKLYAGRALYGVNQIKKNLLKKQ